MKSKLIKSILSLALVAGFISSAAVAAEESQAVLKAQAKVTQEEATKTSLANIPNGKVESVELEKEKGKLIWSFDISTPKSKNIIEVQVDAKTGLIVSRQVEKPSDQAKEATAEKQKK